MSRNSETAAHAILWLIGFVSICWLFWQGVKRNDDPAKILFKCISSLTLVVGEILFVLAISKKLQPGDVGDAFLIAGSLPVLGLALSLIWTPQMSGSLMGLLMGGKIPPESKPDYSRAMAERKRQNPGKAVVAIREHLAKSPNDFEGVLLLANIQAVDLKDLRSAEITLRNFCEWEDAPPKEAAAALARLADWYLEFYQDTSPARGVLQCIVEKYPGTEPALAARERLARLEGTEKKLPGRAGPSSR